MRFGGSTQALAKRMPNCDRVSECRELVLYSLGAVSLRCLLGMSCQDLTSLQTRIRLNLMHDLEISGHVGIYHQAFREVCPGKELVLNECLIEVAYWCHDQHSLNAIVLHICNIALHSCRCDWASCMHLLGSMCQVVTAALNLQVLHLAKGFMARAPACPQLYSHLLDLLVLAGEHRHSCALQFLKVSPLLKSFLAVQPSLTDCPKGICSKAYSPGCAACPYAFVWDGSMTRKPCLETLAMLVIHEDAREMQQNLSIVLHACSGASHDFALPSLHRLQGATQHVNALLRAFN